VYYSWIVRTLSLLALIVAACPVRAFGQVELTWSPSMVKGASGAPVTIIEFSDYQ
jgi:hypothetical protein